jgi:hypothetical protein
MKGYLGGGVGGVALAGPPYTISCACKHSYFTGSSYHQDSAPRSAAQYEAA